MSCKPEGRWMMAWCNSVGRYGAIEKPETLRAIRALGIDGIVVHDIMDPPSWCTPARVELFRAAGLGMAFGIGTGGPSRRARLAELLALSIDACKRANSPVQWVELDWEGSWSGHQDDAAWVVQQVFAKHGDASEFVCDVPWWAPLKTPSGNWSHPYAPTEEFGVLCMGRRYVQAYGAAILDRSRRFLAWARSPTQYASLGDWEIEGTTQLYARSLADCIPLLLQEQHSLHWEWFQMSVTARFAFAVVQALKATGFVGTSAIRDYQTAHPPLKVDGIVGPLTSASLGLTPPAGTDWYGNGND